MTAVKENIGFIYITYIFLVKKMVKIYVETKFNQKFMNILSLLREKMFYKW